MIASCQIDFLGEALKQFCTAWPKGLESEEKQNKHFPVTVISSDYCHSSPSIRNPLARIVTLKVNTQCFYLFIPYILN